MPCLRLVLQTHGQYNLCQYSVVRFDLGVSTQSICLTVTFRSRQSCVCTVRRCSPYILLTGMLNTQAAFCPIELPCLTVVCCSLAGGAVEGKLITGLVCVAVCDLGSVLVVLLLHFSCNGPARCVDFVPCECAASLTHYSVGMMHL